VQESQHYPGGMALRSARVKRYCEDKTAAEADTVDTVLRIFAGGRRQNPTGAVSAGRRSAST
jgi:DNA ligase-1